MPLVFDLDGTLYREADYVLSGLRAVAESLATDLAQTKGQRTMASRYYNHMRGVFLARGRSHVFGSLVDKYRISVPVYKILDAYRNHTPRIALYPDAKRLLERTGQDPIIVTNTPLDVALKKRVALGLDDAYLMADAGKPDRMAFEIVAALVDGPCTYVGDAPSLDIPGARRAGWRTAIVDRCGCYSGCGADLVVDSLDAL